MNVLNRQIGGGYATERGTLLASLLSPSGERPGEGGVEQGRQLEGASTFRRPSPQPSPCQGEGARRQGGFTLVELLVVVGLIAVILTVAVPTMSRIVSDSQVDAARSGVASAVATARAYAPIGGSFPLGEYRGAAVVFTPMNEMRIVRHRYDAEDGSNNLLVLDGRAGYADVPGEPYVSIPSNVGLVGIARTNFTGATEPPALLTPPFAVRFNPSGVLIPGQAGNAGDNQSRIVFYRHEPSDPRYFTGTGQTRSDGYDVDEYDPQVVGRTAQNWDDSEERWRMPFSRLDAVVGVMVYDKNALRSAGHDLVTDDTLGVNEEAQDWILRNGQPLFFNRYSGSGIKP